MIYVPRNGRRIAERCRSGNAQGVEREEGKEKTEMSHRIGGVMCRDVTVAGC